MSTERSPASDVPASRDLPPYRAVLVVDAKSFSDAPSFLQPELNSEIQQTLAAAFDRAGLADAWADRRFPAHTGDGYIAGTIPEYLPRLIDPLLRELQSELQEREHRRLAWEPRLRLRASIHIGPLPDSGVGKPMNDTHRLLDSDQVRQLLIQTHEDVTFVAAIVSRRAYEDAVEGGYTGLHPSQFVEVTATAKRFSDVAYLHVPLSSGTLLRIGAGGGADTQRVDPEAASRRAGPEGASHQSGGISFVGNTTVSDSELTGGDRHGSGRP